MTTAVSSCVKAIEDQGKIMKEMVGSLSQQRSGGVSLQNVLTIAAAIAIIGFVMMQNDQDRFESGIEAVEEEGEAVEKDMITMQASVEALGVRQETLHGLTDTKLDNILSAVKKRNDQ